MRPKSSSGRNARPGEHQGHSGRRDGAPLLHIVTRGNRFDDLDGGLVVGLGELKRDNSVGSGWQSIAGSHFD